MNAHDILNVLSKQKFADWYNSGGRFDQYISDNTVSKDDIIKDIEEIFNIKPIEDFWKPLLKVIDIKDIGDYMYMGEHKDILTDKIIYLYKHYNTRRYLNVNTDGICYSYNPWTEGYFKVSKENAIKHVLS